MGVRSKTLIAVLLVGVVFGVFALSTSNPNLFKGQIFDEPGGETVTEQPADVLLADLSVDLKLIYPDTEEGEEDLIAEVTLLNMGEGAIEGGKPFVYEIFINEVSVFTNSDSYSALDPGDAFSFSYPIPKKIYQYPNEGTVKAVVDTSDSIKESNEFNNEITLDYNF